MSLADNTPAAYLTSLLGPTARCTTTLGPNGNGEPVPYILLEWQDVWRCLYLSNVDDDAEWPSPQVRARVLIEAITQPFADPVPVGREGALSLAEALIATDRTPWDSSGFDSWKPRYFLRLLIDRLPDQDAKAVMTMIALRDSAIAQHLQQ